MTLARAARIRPLPPHRLAGLVRAVRRYRLGAAPAIGALRFRDATALVDEHGTLTFEDLDVRSNALANAWRALGAGEGTGIGVLCRNHRGFVDAVNAAGKVGARAVLLNTEFAPPQAAEVCRREGVELLVHDDEFHEVAAAVDAPYGRHVAWGAAGEGPTLEELIATGAPQPPPRLARSGTIVLLTSGTTGLPKGAQRSSPRSLTTAAGVIAAIPYRSGEATFVAPPFFHAWGLTNLLVTLALGSTVVTHRRFEPGRVLGALGAHGCTGLVVVPVMLRRLVAAADAGADDALALRFIAVSGSQLDGALAGRAMDVFGDVVYNLYGSTEVAVVAIAGPDDLRVAPGCAGRPPGGVSLRVLDDQGQPVGPGVVARIFASNGAEFSGYTGGGGKQVIDDHMATGDVGHVDEQGRLFVDGREDDMIVSGGENVFPGEVEDLLAAHPDIIEAAVKGVPDADFGHRLRAFVVLRDGATLDADAVRAHVRANLARYKVPRDVVFVDHLPRTATGKVLKRELEP
ncbi:MAG: AMP-binding protein [Acidimicrobiales bacterium]|nr:AMP-binding protein [Acidimicrobiales bacterium]